MSRVSEAIKHLKDLQHINLEGIRFRIIDAKGQGFPLVPYVPPPRRLQDRGLGWPLPQGFEPANPERYAFRLRTSPSLQAAAAPLTPAPASAPAATQQPMALGAGPGLAAPAAAAAAGSGSGQQQRQGQGKDKGGPAPS
ncbi:hypothetical protein HXX76_010792 [Chlamydomonas incerta]|uniref:Uncharacterized protein n=1 Tax=Chlamydomonas incerta TaxID=51695 RepID=A0A835SQN3_CHLIN|nr:hypothetical protein HXX76_010792 [Chlamydomonas incerta]|eukprot:KAG2429557.1 hypothetical protein HXX76_010792 [Chlamydomonas incerta]